MLREIKNQLKPLQDLVSGFDFATVVGRYVEGFQAHNDSLMASALRWLRAEYRTKTEAVKTWTYDRSSTTSSFTIT